MYLRKFFVGIASVLNSDPLVQATGIVMVLFGCTSLHLVMMPMQNDSLDHYETFSLILSTFLYMMGPLTSGTCSPYGICARSPCVLLNEQLCYLFSNRSKVLI